MEPGGEAGAAAVGGSTDGRTPDADGVGARSADTARAGSRVGLFSMFLITECSARQGCLALLNKNGLHCTAALPNEWESHLICDAGA